MEVDTIEEVEEEEEASVSVITTIAGTGIRMKVMKERITKVNLYPRTS